MMNDLARAIRRWTEQKLLGAFAPLPLPYDDYKMEPKRLVSHNTSIYLRAPLKLRTFEFSVR